MEAQNFICKWKSGLKLVLTFGIKDSIKETLKFYTLHFYNHTIAHPPKPNPLVGVVAGDFRLWS